MKYTSSAWRLDSAAYEEVATLDNEKNKSRMIAEQMS
jgi:hypothetical protein